LSYEENQANNGKLVEDLCFYSHCPVLAGDRHFQWVEESFAADIELQDVLYLGKKYFQNAIYYVSEGQIYLHSCVDEQIGLLGTVNDRIIKNLR